MAKPSAQAPGLDRLIQKLQNRQQFLESQDGREVNLGTEKTFVQGNFLHQDTEDMTEQQSAQFEIDNQEVFRWLRSFANQVKK